jgi:tetratricopeptide (TPR) repeat protein
MNRSHLVILIAVTTITLSPIPVLPSQMTLDSRKQYRFALDLMAREEYRKAVVELERLVYFFPEDPEVPRARYLMGKCHLMLKEYESAREVLLKVYQLYPRDKIAAKALFLIGESYYRQGFPDEAASYFERTIQESPDSELRNAAFYRLGWSRMKEDRWKDASESFARVHESSRLYPSAMDLAHRSIEAEALPFKDPAAAGVMAGMLPGLGHAYCNRYKDGAVAFLLNGLFVWATVEAFDEDLPVLGGILGFVTLGWYSGNIYSAVNCAHKHNKKLKDDFRRQFPDNLDVDLLATREGHLGLVLHFDF